MSTALKCPNPSCPYLFDPSRVPAGVVLTCPRCGMRFTLGAQTPAAPPAAPPGSPPAPPTDSSFDALSAAQPGTVAEPAGPAYRAAGGTTRLQVVIYSVMTFALIAGAALVVYLGLGRGPRGPGGETAAQLRELNLSFEPPEKPWVQDEEMKVKMRPPVILVYHRPDADAYMAFGAKDYSTRMPRLSELRDGLSGPLNTLFEDIRPEDLAGARWLGQPAAAAYTFRARMKGEGVTVFGECHAVAYKGVGYWSICWAPEDVVKEQVPVFDRTRGHFRLLDQRENWREREAPVTPFRGHAAEYQILDAEGIWKDSPHKPADEDPRADLLLVARDKRRGADKADEAELIVFVLDAAGGDPLAEGQKYVEGFWTERVKAGGLTPMFEKLTGEPEGDPTPNTVEATAPVVRLDMTVRGDRNQRRLLVVSALKVDNKLAVVQAYCSWRDRAVFEPKLIQIAGSLREAR